MQTGMGNGKRPGKDKDTYVRMQEGEAQELHRAPQMDDEMKKRCADKEESK
jgi:hypothetical protein